MAAKATVQDWQKDHWREGETDTDHAERVAHADELAGWYFTKATAGQTADHRAAVASAEALHGHGSRAHSAAIDLAKRNWAEATKEARDLFNATAAEIVRDGEVSEATSEKWDALSRPKQHTAADIVKTIRATDANGKPALSEGQAALIVSLFASLMAEQAKSAAHLS